MAGTRRVPAARAAEVRFLGYSSGWNPVGAAYFACQIETLQFCWLWQVPGVNL